MRVKRSSSAAAITRPSSTRQAAESWYTALMPSVLIEWGGKNRRSLQQLHGGRSDRFRSNALEAVVVAFGADALVAIAAGHVVVEHAARHPPGGVLRIGERVKVHHRRAERRGDVRRPGV